jgi:hypothetical protein
MNDAIEGLDTLERSLAEIASAAAPAEVFRALLEGTRAAAPRAALLLARGGTWKGWGSVGYPPAPSARFRAVSLDAAHPSVESILAEPGGFASLPGTGALADFGQGDAVEAAALVLRIGERPVALAVAERRADEGPWQPAALRILGHAARLRLELDLAWRRLRVPSKPEPPETGRIPEPPSPAPSPTEAAGLEPADSGPAVDPALEGARRFARLVATEIRLYNEESVLLGRKHGDLATRLADPIEQGRATFARRFPDLGEDGARLLEEAYLQVLAGGDSSLLPRR